MQLFVGVVDKVAVSCVSYREWVGQIMVIISSCILYLKMAQMNERGILSSSNFLLSYWRAKVPLKVNLQVFLLLFVKEETYRFFFCFL